MIHAVLHVALLFACSGCVATSAEQAIDQRQATSQPTSVPTSGHVESAIQQAGAVSVAAPIAVPIEAPGWTGVAYSTAVPLGQVVIMLGQLALMAAVIYLSHRREIERIKASNK